MGTRADFYVGRGKDAEWIGSVGWDGYPDGFDDDELFKATNKEEWRKRVSAMLASREDSTLPEAGWPWPWDDSTTTDYSYAYEDGVVWASCFGRGWWRAADPQPEEGIEFPDMSGRKNVRLDGGSGIIIVGS